MVVREIVEISHNIMMKHDYERPEPRGNFRMRAQSRGNMVLSVRVCLKGARITQVMAFIV